MPLTLVKCLNSNAVYTATRDVCTPRAVLPRAIARHLNTLTQTGRYRCVARTCGHIRVSPLSLVERCHSADDAECGVADTEISALQHNRKPYLRLTPVPSQDHKRQAAILSTALCLHVLADTDAYRFHGRPLDLLDEVRRPAASTGIGPVVSVIDCAVHVGTWLPSR